MKKVLALLLALTCGPALAQQGIFPANTVWGNATGSSAQAKATPFTSFPPGMANPTGAVGLSVVNGSATTAMRSDAAPPLSSSVQSALTGTNAYILQGTGSFGFSAEQYCTLTQGCLGGSQAAALANSVPIFPGSGGAAAPIGLPYLNVMQSPYNAKCDGSTEDAAAFSSAATAANAAGGGILTAPEGVVCIIGKTTTFITLQSNTYIAGHFTLRKGSASVNDPIVFASGKSNVGVFGGVTIDMIDSSVGTSFGNNAAIQFANTTNTYIDNVNIVNMGAFGISLNGGTYRVTHNTITLNTPSIHQNLGISIACTNASSGLIEGNTLVGTAMLTCGSQTQILSNRISGWAYGTGIGHGGGPSSGSPCGVSIGGNPGCDDIIGYNVITNGAQGADENSTYAAGIENFDANTLIIGNVIVGNGGNGITQDAPSSVVNNVIVDNCTSIISVVGFPECAGLFSRYDSATKNASSATYALNQVYNSFANLTVTGTASAGGLIRLSVASTTSVGPTNTQFLCFVSGVGGTTEANGGWTCKVTGATTIDLLASTFVNAWTSGGTIGGTQAYAYSEGSASLSSIRLNDNTLTNGRTGTKHILSSTTTQVVECSTSTGCGTTQIISDKTGTTSTASFVMLGLAGTFTPVRSGNILITITGDGTNGTSGDGCSIGTIRYGTGSAPANGAAVTGTSAGNKAFNMTTAANNQITPFTATAYKAGFTVGVANWIDLTFAALTGGTCTLKNVTIVAVEM